MTSQDLCVSFPSSGENLDDLNNWITSQPNPSQVTQSEIEQKLIEHTTPENRGWIAYRSLRCVQSIGDCEMTQDFFPIDLLVDQLVAIFTQRAMDDTFLCENELVVNPQIIDEYKDHINDIPRTVPMTTNLARVKVWLAKLSVQQRSWVMGLVKRTPDQKHDDCPQTQDFMWIDPMKDLICRAFEIRLVPIYVPPGPDQKDGGGGHGGGGHGGHGGKKKKKRNTKWWNCCDDDDNDDHDHYNNRDHNHNNDNNNDGAWGCCCCIVIVVIILMLLIAAVRMKK